MASTTQSRFFGFFREQPHSAGSRISIHDGLGTDPNRDASAVAGYLRGGTVMLEADEIVRDLLDPGHPVIGSLALLTDGAWVWPVDLPHYVERHGLRIPDDFLERIHERNWRCAQLTREQVHKLLAAIPGSRPGDRA